LPRLANFITINGPDEFIENPVNFAASNKEAVHGILTNLAYWLEKEERAKKIEQTFYDYITMGENITGGFSIQLLSFLMEVVGGDGSRTVKVLKACHQARAS
jgi:hypothetical protein